MQLPPLYSKREMSAWEETHAAWNAEILEVRQSNQLVLEIALWGHSIKPGLCREALWDCVLLPNATGDLRNIPPPLWISNYSVRAGGDWTKWLMRFLPAQIVHSVNTFNNPAQPVVFVHGPSPTLPTAIEHSLHGEGVVGVGYLTVITSIPIVISTVCCVFQMNDQINGALEHRECALEWNLVFLGLF